LGKAEFEVDPDGEGDCAVIPVQDAGVGTDCARVFFVKNFGNTDARSKGTTVSVAIRVDAKNFFFMNLHPRFSDSVVFYR
jgi:hypothetical protein